MLTSQHTAPKHRACTGLVEELYILRKTQVTSPASDLHQGAPLGVEACKISASVHKQPYKSKTAPVESCDYTIRRKHIVVHSRAHHTADRGERCSAMQICSCYVRLMPQQQRNDLR